MTGKQLKEILKVLNISQAEVARLLYGNLDEESHTTQRLSSALKSDNLKSGLIEEVAKSINKSVYDLYKIKECIDDDAKVVGDGSSNVNSEVHIDTSAALTKALDEMAAQREASQSTIDRLLSLLEKQQNSHQ